MIAEQRWPPLQRWAILSPLRPASKPAITRTPYAKYKSVDAALLLVPAGRPCPDRLFGPRIHPRQWHEGHRQGRQTYSGGLLAGAVAHVVLGLGKARSQRILTLHRREWRPRERLHQPCLHRLFPGNVEESPQGEF